MPLTFVTAFMNLFESREGLRSPDIYISQFRMVALSGIPIILFISSSYRDHYERICGDLENVRIEYIELYEFETYTDIESINLKLPPERNHVKDTRNYLILMNTKLECIYRAMQFTDATHYAWIDFGIQHVLSPNINSRLQTLAMATFVDTCLVMPGCWQKVPVFFDKIHWRFCGGFFLGDRDSLTSFYKASKENWKTILVSYCLTWEVNYWAFLEEMKLIQPIWYLGDHNDTILNVPEIVYI